MMIPSGIFSIYFQAMNDFLDNDYIGKACTIYYPPLKTACSNCTTGWFAGVSRNVYKHGGPAPFEGQCPLCGGNGYSEVEQSDSIRLRTYWSRRDWFTNREFLQLAGASLAQVDVMVIGYKADLNKVERAIEFDLASEANLQGRYRLSGKPVPHGFAKDHYFVAFMQRT